MELIGNELKELRMIAFEIQSISRYLEQAPMSQRLEKIANMVMDNQIKIEAKTRQLTKILIDNNS